MCPEDRILKAKALMQLKRAQVKALQLPNAEALLQKMEHEYNLLLERMQAYFELQKTLLTQKKAGIRNKKEQLLQSYNEFDVRKQDQELQQNFQLQQRQWQLFIAQYA